MKNWKALVIGNSQYLLGAPLRNPANDARAIAEVLKRLGFTTITGIDLDRDAMEDKLEQFGQDVADAEVALFYYAGHGIQVSGENYIVPVDADVRTQNQLKRRTFALNDVLEVMTSTAVSSIAFLDACRDNPFPSTLPRGSASATRGAARVSSGLAEVSTSQGAFVAFATGPNKVAKDGSSDHSPFTEAVLKYIEEPDISIGDFLIKVRVQVYDQTKGEQEPWDQSSLRTRFVFSPTTRKVSPEGDAPAQTQSEPPAIERPDEPIKQPVEAKERPAQATKESVSRQPDEAIKQDEEAKMQPVGSNRQPSRPLIVTLMLLGGLAILFFAWSKISVRDPGKHGELEASHTAPSDPNGAAPGPTPIVPTPGGSSTTFPDSPKDNSTSSPPVVPRTLLETIGATGTWCTASHTYRLSVSKSIIIWTDNKGAVNKESIVSNSAKEAVTTTQKSASQPEGTIWTYTLVGPGLVMVKSDNGGSFSLKRC